MKPLLDQNDGDLPEKLTSRVVAQLRNHVLWDSLLLFLPPLSVALYLAIYLYHSAWITQITLLAAGAAAIGAAWVGVLVRYRPAVPSARDAARLVDEKAAAQDRFMTLATIEPSACSTTLLGRLRREANGFLDRIELRRDFPYKIKHSIYGSIMGSILAAVLLHLLLPHAQSKISSPAPHEQIRALAEKMAQRPRLSELARGLETLATRLEDPKNSRQDKQALIQEMQRKVQEQQKREDQKDNRDLLGQAASTLQGLEPQSGDGRNQQKDQDKGGGGVQSNLPQEGQGEAKPNPGSGGDSKGDLNARLSKDMQQGKSAQGDPKDQGQEKNQQNQGEGKGNQPDPNKPDRDKSGETAGKSEGASGERAGRSKASEEIPQGAQPAERFYQAGEKGKEAIKGARYVTVQLPEEAASEAKGESGGTRESKGRRVRPQGPVSNVPLPAHLPDAPTEKQHMPLEYRGIIR